MGIIRRHMLVETLNLFGAALVITLLLMTLGGGAREGLREGLPPELVLQSLPYLVPEMLRFTIPSCLLFAVCSVFGRMTVSNELVAIRSLGISPLRVVWPILGFAFLLSLVTFQLYDVCAQWGRPGLRQLVAGSLDKIAYGVLRTNGSFRRPGLSILVKGVENDQLLSPLIELESGGDKPVVTLSAKSAKLSTDANRGTMHLECRNGKLDVAGKGSFRFPDVFEQDLEINPPDPNAKDHLSPADLGSRVIPQQIAREQRIVADLETLLGAARSEEDLTQTANLQATLDSHRARLYRLETEIPRRLSNGFGCLCFALLGVPVAMWGKSGDAMSIFFRCFLPILAVYYPLLVTGENLARSGFLPLLSAWLADAVLCLAGVLLLRRTLRY